MVVVFIGWNLNLAGLRGYWNQRWDAEEEIICECIFFVFLSLYMGEYISSVGVGCKTSN